MFWFLAFLIKIPDIKPLLDEKAAHATVSPHATYMYTYKCHITRHYCCSGDFSNGVCHVMKIAIVECYPDMGLITSNVWLSPQRLARDNKMPVMTMPVASDQSACSLLKLFLYNQTETVPCRTEQSLNTSARLKMLTIVAYCTKSLFGQTCIHLLPKQTKKHTQQTNINNNKNKQTKKLF